jgi:hypothetical protein
LVKEMGVRGKGYLRVERGRRVLGMGH